MSKTVVEKFNEEYGLLNINREWFRQPTKEEKEVKIQRIISGKSHNVWTDIIKRFFKNRWNTFFLIILLALVLTIIIAPIVSKYYETDKVSRATTAQISLMKPGWINHWDYYTKQVNEFDLEHNKIPGIFFESFGNHPKNVISIKPVANMPGEVIVTYRNAFGISTILGTDTIGRDVWTRLWSGAGWSLRLAFFVAVVETVIGVTIGIFVGFNAGKKIDTFLMRIIDIFNSVPSLLWMFLFALIIGTSFWSMALVLILVGWTAPVYSARMFTLKIKDAEFVKAAESVGVSKTGCLFKHILPNVFGRLLVSFIQRIPAVIFFETSLIFLGMNVGGSGEATIGNLVQDARTTLAMSSNITYVMSIVGFLLVLMVSLQILANGIRDAFDPKVSG